MIKFIGLVLALCLLGSAQAFDILPEDISRGYFRGTNGTLINALAVSAFSIEGWTAKVDGNDTDFVVFVNNSETTKINSGNIAFIINGAGETIELIDAGGALRLEVNSSSLMYVPMS